MRLQCRFATMLACLLLTMLAVYSSQSKPFFNDSKVYGPYPDPESIVKTFNIDSSDFAHQQEDGVKIWRFNIASEGCGSARFNLNPFDMAQGDYIVVYGVDTDGQQTAVERYKGKGRRDDGDVNTRRVWAKELVLEMHSSSPHSHFVLNYVHYANCFHQRPGIPESICGEIDWLNIICYRDDDPMVFNEGPSVFRIRFVENGESYLCTGWKATDNNRFLTNWHCLGTQTVTSTAELDYKYDSTSCSSDTGNAAAVYHGDTMIQTSGSDSLDFTIFTVSESASDVRCLTFTDIPPDPIEDFMSIIHHPNGLRKKVSDFSDQDIGAFCRRASSCSHSNDYCYMCDTADGSCGSPVFFWKPSGRLPVFALHHFGGCPNSGVKMSLVVEAAGSNLGACSG